MPVPHPSKHVILVEQNKLPISALQELTYKWVLNETYRVRSQFKVANPWAARTCQEISEIRKRMFSESSPKMVVSLAEDGVRRISSMSRLAGLNPDSRLRFEPKPGSTCSACRLISSKTFTLSNLPDHVLEDHGTVLQVLFG